uniref:6-HYDROXY-D-NICOTINE OXIDASE n=1 Tax=Paenarthrobacter nicotinovorans TaxID=29320 RepID=UPI000059CF19|nr:Chain A, 6-hydroxy-d-nicotine Oxidase [Paenarthrobacter nicotinovorans]2BVF_B Chain B, 6-hydroxy-d-nicotine Oxidase [Paenarthrobacter nicotinovorans]2BVG_A Chain A, 6-HYDROXY-D-NICOTINE OXIDASE [Paenarthrobacter nicotinovorans]2BVG_B Chain B, 6-HYDROXY-D-NICOTINE OXIDASE [Paenarthrobacter nicotinovorans]2BVG_C Chain C, 6-HYDROXY-D-NICOTINE OXIDASE [Paenarthrobacter nicotinovorans]2BVG_D Chain D, 6-HYDROXY-D-NICOTINE OXIDASE [Paenarthrobacter nicotinovorans]2BVH_A Chain A, 6-HYDROXY-D-NICOT
MVSSKLATPLSIQGEVIYPDDSGFDAIANIWDGRHLQRPSLIARCLSAGDVAKSVRYACDNGLEISVRSGGHNPNGYATNDGGIVLDLRLMNSIHIDTAGSRARIGGGVISGDLVKEAAKFGLAAVTGMHPKVGFCGLALNGGVGFLTPKYGLASDNILGATLVTATGDVIYCSDDERPELFWAVRGAGPNFGVVTEVEVQLYELPRKMLAGFITWAPSVSELAGLLTSLLDALNEMADHIYPSVFVGVDENRAPSVTVCVGHLGGLDIAERDIARLRGLGRTVSDSIAVRSYDEVVALNAEVGSFEDGMSNLWIDREIAMPNARFAEAIAGNLDKFVSEPASGGSVKLEIEGMPFGNPKRTPARHRDAMGVLALAEWSGAAPGSEKYPELARELDAALLRAGVTTSGFGLLNNNSEVTAEMVAEVYKPEVYSRLAAVKREYDPENRFRHNYNIDPEGS